ncbi:hypothetical protein [Microbacterium oxydans]|nr:hypothetical protein [Microbacterium oxydans]
MNVTRLARRASGALVVAGTLALAACTSAPASSSGGDGELTTLKVATIGLVSDGALIRGQ